MRLPLFAFAVALLAATAAQADCPDGYCPDGTVLSNDPAMCRAACENDFAACAGGSPQCNGVTNLSELRRRRTRCLNNCPR